MVNHQGYQHQTETPQKRKARKADQKVHRGGWGRGELGRESWRTSGRLGYQFTESCPASERHLVLMGNTENPSSLVPKPHPGVTWNREVCCTRSYFQPALCNPGPRGTLWGQIPAGHLERSPLWPPQNQHSSGHQQKSHQTAKQKSCYFKRPWSSFINVCQIPQSLSKPQFLWGSNSILILFRANSLS